MTMSNEMNLTPAQIESEKAYESMGLSDAEYKRAKEIMERQPNLTETGIFSVMWSEHCSYKTSKPLLSKFPTKAPHVLMGPGEGAGVRSEEHTSELQSRGHLVCRLLLAKKKTP